MSTFHQLRRLYWCYFSKPKSARTLYRTLCRTRATSIVELGISDPDRSLRLIRLAEGFSRETPVSYTAIDLFDARPTGQVPLTLKQAHRHFSASAAKIKLVPGLPSESLAGSANTLLGTDLVLFAHDVASDPSSRLWFFLPRLLHAQSRVLRHGCMTAEDPEPPFCEIERAEIERLAASQMRRQVA